MHTMDIKHCLKASLFHLRQRNKTASWWLSRVHPPHPLLASHSLSLSRSLSLTLTPPLYPVLQIRSVKRRRCGSPGHGPTGLWVWHADFHSLMDSLPSASPQMTPRFWKKGFPQKALQEEIERLLTCKYKSVTTEKPGGWGETGRENGVYHLEMWTQIQLCNMEAE